MAIQINNTAWQEWTYSDPVFYEVTATGEPSLSYQWQYSDNTCNIDLMIWQDLNDQNLLVEGANTNKIKLYPEYVISNINRVYRVVVSSSNGQSSNSSLFGRCDKPVVAISAASSSFENNGQGKFIISVFSTAILSNDMFLIPNFSWQKSTNDGITWDTIIFDANGDGIIDITDANATVAAGLFYEKIDNKINVYFSTSRSIKIRAIVTVTGANPEFSPPINLNYSSSTTQTESLVDIIFSGTSSDTFGNTVYSVIGSTNDNTNVEYQWQISTDGSNWENLLDSSLSTGTRSPNLRLSPLYFQQYPNRVHRCVLSSITLNVTISKTFGSTNYGALFNFLYSGGLNNADPAKSIGGSYSTNFILGNLNNLFSDISKDDSEIGVIDYRCFYIANDSENDTLYNASIFVTSEYNSQSSVQIGISRESEVQVISLNSIPSSGYFKLKIGPATTPEIYWDSNNIIFENNIRNALNYLDEIETIVSKTLLNNYQVSFVGISNYRNYDLLQVVENTLSPSTIIKIEKLTEGQPINSVAPRIFNSQSAPFNVTFYDTNFNNRLSLGNLHPSDIIPIWIRRYTSGTINDDQLNGFNIRLSGNKNPNSSQIIPTITYQQEDKPDFYYG